MICYFSAGSGESWRSDYKQFPSRVVGNKLEGWEGERWLDVRDSSVLQVLSKRLDLAKSKGCHAKLNAPRPVADNKHYVNCSWFMSRSHAMYSKLETMHPSATQG